MKSRIPPSPGDCPDQNKNKGRLSRIRHSVYNSRLLKVANALVLRGLGSGLAVLLTLFVIRYMDNYSAATFLLIFTVTYLFAVCFRWGLDDVIIRRVAADPSAGMVAYLMRLAHRRVAIWMMFTGAATAAIKVAGVEQLAGIEITEVFWIIFTAGLIALTACAGRVHQGMSRTNYASLIINIIQPGLLLLGLLVLINLGIQASAWRLQLVFTGLALTIYVGVVWGASLTRPYPSRSMAAYDGKSALASLDRKSANHLGGVVLSQQSLNWIAPPVVLLAYGDELFNSFMATYKLALLTNLAMLAVNFTFAPRVAALFSAGEYKKLKRLAGLMATAVATASLLCAGLIFGARRLIYSFAGVDEIGGLLALLITAQLFFSLSAVYALFLGMCGDERFLFRLLTGTVTMGSIFFLILSYTAPLEISSATLVVTYVSLALVIRHRAIRVVGNLEGEKK